MYYLRKIMGGFVYKQLILAYLHIVIKSIYNVGGWVTKMGKCAYIIYVWSLWHHMSIGPNNAEHCSPGAG